MRTIATLVEAVDAAGGTLALARALGVDGKAAWAYKHGRSIPRRGRQAIILAYLADHGIALPVGYFDRQSAAADEARAALRQARRPAPRRVA